jgi:tetratricopeptide (TPR) repeat protein
MACLWACATAPVVPDAKVLPDPATQDPVVEAELSAAWNRANTTTDPNEREQATTDLARAAERRHLPFVAFIYFDAELRGGPSPQLFPAIEALVRIQSQLEDAYLIPSELAKYYDAAAWAQLPPDVLARVKLLVAQLNHRRGKLAEALELVRAVPPASAVHARAKYLEGIVLSDPRSTRGPERFDEAMAAFRSVVEHAAPEQQEDFDNLRGLATLGLGRVAYGAGRFADAVHWYAKAEQLERARPAALFEGAYARFQNDDRAGALKLLNRPELGSAFFPEAVTFEGLIHYLGTTPPTPAELEATQHALAKVSRFSALAARVKQRLAQVDPDGSLGLRDADADAIFATAAARKAEAFEQTRRVGELGGDRRLLSLLEPQGGLPPEIVAELRSRVRLMRVIRLLEQVERERAAVAAVPAWQASHLSDELATYLQSNEDLLGKVANQLVKNAVIDIVKTVRAFESNADVIALESHTLAAQFAHAGAFPKGDHTARAIVSLEKLLPLFPDDAPEKAELLHRLTELYRDRADEHLQDVAAKGELVEAARRQRQVLEQFPRYERRDELLFDAGATAEQLHDNFHAAEYYDQLLRDFPRSSRADEARARRAQLR